MKMDGSKGGATMTDQEQWGRCGDQHNGDHCNWCGWDRAEEQRERWRGWFDELIKHWGWTGEEWVEDSWLLYAEACARATAEQRGELKQRDSDITTLKEMGGLDRKEIEWLRGAAKEQMFKRKHERRRAEQAEAKLERAEHLLRDGDCGNNGCDGLGYPEQIADDPIDFEQVQCQWHHDYRAALADDPAAEGDGGNDNG